MSINNLSEMSAAEIISKLVLEKSFKEEDYSAILHAIWEKMESVIDLVPLLDSGDLFCQSIAVYIAEEEGDKAKPIFNKLLPLLESPWVEVRDGVCACFFNCTNDPDHYVLLLRHLDDAELQIRLSVITTIFGLEVGLLSRVQLIMENDSKTKALSNGISVLIDQLNNDLSDELLKLKAVSGDRYEKIFTYIAAYKKYGNDERFSEIVILTNDSEIQKHYEIYFFGGDDSKSIVT